MHAYPVFFSVFLIISASLIGATITCNRNLGQSINFQDCQESLSDLKAALIHNDLSLRAPVLRIFGRGNERNHRDRLPQGFPWRSCAVGLDIYGNDPRRTVASTWQPMYDELVRLIDTCVTYGEGIGGSLVKNGFHFVVVNPSSPNVLGTCLASPTSNEDLGQCILDRASSAARASREAQQARANQRSRQRAHEIYDIQSRLRGLQRGPDNTGIGARNNTSADAQPRPVNLSRIFEEGFAESSSNEPPGMSRRVLLPGPAVPITGGRPPSAPVGMPVIPIASVPRALLLPAVSPLSLVSTFHGQQRAQGVSWVEDGTWLQQGPRGPQGVWIYWGGFFQPLGTIQRAFVLEGPNSREFAGLIPADPMRGVFTVINGQMHLLVGGTPPPDRFDVLWVAPGTPQRSMDVGSHRVVYRAPLVP